MKPTKVTLQEAVNEIKSGERLVLGHAAVTPNCVVDEIVRQQERFTNLSIFQMIYLGEQKHVVPECEGHLRVLSPFLFGDDVRVAVQEGRADFIPIHFSYVPQLFEPFGTFPPDWAIVQVAPPDSQGRYSTSLSSDFTLPAARKAKRVLAVLNPLLPRIGGDNYLMPHEIDFMVEYPSEPYTLPTPRESSVDQQIATFCASLIPDHATLQMGIGAIPDAVLSRLENHKDLGIHTEMFTDGVMGLIEKGVITGKYKGSEVGRIVSSFVMGSKALYNYIDSNPEIELYPVDYTNNPYVIGKHPKFISINSCIQIDLYGQVCSEKLGETMYSGSGGQLDYLRGVRYSKEGKSILALPSTAKGGTISRITPNLHPQGVVTSPRNDVDYIVTEYGIASIFGKSEAQRALELVRVAHPDFREELEREAYERFAIRRLF